MTINIIGFGFVGSSVAAVCEHNSIPFNVADTQSKTGNFEYFDTIEKLVENSELTDTTNFYFVAVPTPSKENGECNTSIVESVLSELQKRIKKSSYVIIKSTLVPGTMDKLSSIIKNDNMTLVLSPEFLREITAHQDMINAPFVLLGSEKDVSPVKDLFRQIYSHNKDIQVLCKTFKECEVFKYTLNTLLATKVWFFNEIYEVCESLGVSYESVKELCGLDDRIGSYGTIVPHLHGFGFAGTCLIKDSSGMMKLQESLGIDNSVLQALLRRNENIRKKNK